LNIVCKTENIRSVVAVVSSRVAKIFNSTTNGEVLLLIEESDGGMELFSLLICVLRFFNNKNYDLI